jgi:hypothetical protein
VLEIKTKEGQRISEFCQKQLFFAVYKISLYFLFEFMRRARERREKELFSVNFERLPVSPAL